MGKPAVLLLGLSLLTFRIYGDTVRSVFDRAVADFQAGRIGESVRGFDQVARLDPDSAPHLWQRGIALYYAGRFNDCRAQFEAHRTVNPADVENAAWHYLCVARASSPDEAKRRLLPTGPDSREPMTDIYAMLKGERSPQAVLQSAGHSEESQFFAHLYTGLWFEAAGNAAAAGRELRLAADDRYRSAGYMHRVAQVHVALMQRARPAENSELWRFDRLDIIGGHKTTVRGRPRIVDTPQGKAIEFEGVSDAIFLDVHPLAGAQTFTWEVVFRPDAGGAPEQRFFHLQERDPVSGADTATRLLFETRLVGEEWYLDSFALSGKESKALIRPDRRHPLGRFYHVAMTYDGTTFRNYVNGEMEGSAELSLTPQGQGHSSAGVRINLRDYFKGAIHSARFTRRALTPAEFMKQPVRQ